MRTILALLVALPVAAAAAPVPGQVVTYHDTSADFTAIVSQVNGDGSASLVLLDPDGYSTWWPSSVAANFEAADATTQVVGAAQGSSTGQWSVVSANVPSAGQLVSSTSTPSLTLNGSAAQFDASHDTEYTVTVKIATTLSLTGGAAGHVDLLCDSTTTPSTVVETVSSESTGTVVVGVALTSSNTLVMRYRVPAAQRCRLTTTNDTGTPTFTLVRQVLQTL